MRIFINGDSHTYGSELSGRKNCYSYKLANMIYEWYPDDALLEIYNPAKGGASNDRIFRTTEKYLYDCDISKKYPNIIIIGWSQYIRKDWFYEGAYRSLTQDDGVPFNYNNGDILFEGDDKEKYVDRLLYSTKLLPYCTEESNFFMKEFIRYYQEKIYNLHLELEHRKIPHIFFNSCESFYTYNNEPNETYGLKRYDWNNCFWNPYTLNGSFCEYYVSKGYTKTEYNHLKEDAHEDFAKLLLNHISSYKLISRPSDNY